MSTPSGESDEGVECVTSSSSDLVRYLKLLNRIIDGLDPTLIQRCVMALGVLGTTIPLDVTDFPKLFEHLNKVGKCGPQNLTLLENMLESISRPDLVRLVISHAEDPNPLLTTHLSKAVESVDATQGRLSTELSLELSSPEVVDNGYTIRWRVAQCDHVLLQARASGSSALRAMDVQRMFISTSQGAKFLVWEAQPPEQSTVSTWKDVAIPLEYLGINPRTAHLWIDTFGADSKQILLSIKPHLCTL